MFEKVTIGPNTHYDILFFSPPLPGPDFVVVVVGEEKTAVVNSIGSLSSVSIYLEQEAVRSQNVIFQREWQCAGLFSVENYTNRISPCLIQQQQQSRTQSGKTVITSCSRILQSSRSRRRSEAFFDMDATP